MCATECGSSHSSDARKSVFAQIGRNNMQMSEGQLWIFYAGRRLDREPGGSFEKVVRPRVSLPSG